MIETFSFRFGHYFVLIDDYHYLKLDGPRRTVPAFSSAYNFGIQTTTAAAAATTTAAAATGCFHFRLSGS